jgi:Arc/MetJ-type ribon-helix-helix transcriptional regulator
MTTEMPPKKRVTISISEDVLDWIDRQVEKRIYKDRSHAVEKLIYDKKQETEKPNKTT